MATSQNFMQSTPAPDPAMPWWGAALGGAMQGAGGQMQLQQQQAMAQRQQQMDLMKSILPAFAQSNKLSFAPQGQAGDINAAGIGFNYDPNATTPAQQLDQARAGYYNQRTSNQPDPNVEAKVKAIQGIAATNPNFFGSGKIADTQDALNNMFGSIDSVVPPKSQTPSQAASKMFAKKGTQKSVVKKQYSPDGKQTKLTYSDGTSDIVDGIQ